ncbi:MAG: polysaccharide biosynthesis C-terminal domain-containing protein [Planctomycetota bacterium]
MAESSKVSVKTSAGAEIASRGVVYLAGSQATMVVFGYVIHIAAARLLAPADYGRFVVVLSVMTFIKILQAHVLVSGLRKVVSEDHRRIHAALGVGAKWYSAMIAVLLLSYLAMGPVLAKAFKDDALTTLLALSAIEIPFFAILSLSGNLLSGVRRYSASGIPLAFYGAVRAAAACTLLFLGFGAAGAVLGQVLGSVAAAALSLAFCLRVRSEIPSVPYPAMLGEAVSWTALALPAGLGLIALANLDIWFVKPFVKDASLVGLYGTAYALSRLPQFLVIGMAGAVFPRVSGAMAEGKGELARKVSAQSVRLLLVIFVPLVVITAGSSAGICRLLFSRTYEAAALPLAILMAAMSLYAVVTLLCTLIAAANRPGVRMWLVLSLLPVGFALNWALIPRWGLVGAASASLVTFAAGTIASVVLVRRCLGPIPFLWTLVRCLAAGGIVYVAGLLWPASGAMVASKVVLLGVLYLVLLFALREIRGEDLREARRIISRPGPGPRNEVSAP